jgi:hypothetical protein
MKLREIDKMIKVLKGYRLLQIHVEFPGMYEYMGMQICNHGIDIETLMTSRDRSVIDLKRYLIVYFKEQSYSIANIALFFNMNHSTVISHIKKHADLYAYDPDYKTYVNSLNNG